jgi:hypothetical protein
MAEDHYIDLFFDENDQYRSKVFRLKEGHEIYFTIQNTGHYELPYSLSKIDTEEVLTISKVRPQQSITVHLQDIGCYKLEIQNRRRTCADIRLSTMKIQTPI